MIIIKTEDGVQYPEEAYAYVPDPEKPSTWKLRLWDDPERKVTIAQLGRAAAALSPGGFRGNKVQIPTEDIPKVKRRIRAEYRKLGVTEFPASVMESERREFVNEAFTAELEEVNSANIEKGIVPVRFLVPGFNSSKGRYYTENAIKDAVNVFENCKMYANHPTKTELSERPERDIKGWVGTLKNCSISSLGNAIGEAHIHAGWLREYAQNLNEQGNLNQLAVSILGVGKVTQDTIDGIKTNVVEGIVKGNSVDFVTEPGAGGRAGLIESLSSNDVDIIDYNTLKEHRPDLIQLIEEEIGETYKQEVKKLSETTDENSTLQESLESLQKENEELKAKIAESERLAKVSEAKAEISKLLSESELPDIAKKRLEKLYEGKESSEGLKEAIEDELNYVKSLNEAKVVGMGKPPVAKPEPIDLTESFKALGLSDTEAKIAAGTL